MNALVKNLAVATGKRKTSIARVFLGTARERSRSTESPSRSTSPGMETAQNVRSPLDVTNNVGKFDVMITVKGGGVISQIEACRHGVARALNSYDAANHTALRANGFLTRDSRMVERKKYGQAGARRRFQFSKR